MSDKHPNSAEREEWSKKVYDDYQLYLLYLEDGIEYTTFMRNLFIGLGLFILVCLHLVRLSGN